MISLLRAWPEAGPRGLMRFEWLGCGDGRWNVVPLYETVPTG